jgi:hypothetical protein
MKWKPMLLASITAMIVSLLLTFALRTTGLPYGLRMGVAFFVYLMVQSVLMNRFAEEKKSRGNWIATFVIAIVSAVLIGVIGSE